LLNENLPEIRHDFRFKWLYQENPCGTARAWLALDRESGLPMGVASIFPRFMWVGGKTVLCGQVGDFAIVTRFRSLGPALLLQRATLTPFEEGNMAFCYDTPPNERGMATFRRMGISPIGRALRFAKPLKVDRKLKGFAKNEALIKGPSYIGNLILRLLDRMRNQRNGNCQLELHNGFFGDEFSTLDKLMVSHYRIYSQRNSNYLNWRYHNDPLHRYEVAVARFHGELVAYTIFEDTGDDACLMDIFGQEGAMEDLLAYVVEVLRTRSTMTLHAAVLEGSFLIPILKKMGFYFRENGHWIVVYPQQTSQIYPWAIGISNWFMTYSDVAL